MISDRYVVGDIVGTGAFATVYRALDPRLDSPVAIKVLADNWSADPAVCERFGREATLLRRVRSERRGAPLVEVFDIDQSADGRPFFVMSFADRGTLAERFVEGQAWPTAAVQQVIDTLGAGLHALHAAEIVHRDIKPSNLLYLTQADAAGGEELLIGDLGLAKDLLVDATELTVAGGTPGYMAPEQHRADATVTPAADVYSASVIVAELLSGRRGLTGIEQLSEPTRTELRRGIAPHPANRHESIGAWRTALTNSLAAPPQPAAAPAYPAPTTEPVADAPATQPSSSRKSLLIAAAVAAAVAVLVAVLLLRGGDPDIAIVGPDTAPVGETVFYRADVPSGGSHVWTVGTTTVTDLDLRLTPQSVGTIVIQLAYTDDAGAVTNAERTIVVTNE